MSNRCTIRQIQEKILEIAIEIDRLCRTNQIMYYISDGSCLGAVRHGGFIPWDDDFDIIMPRSDYNRFKEICATQLRSPFFYQDRETDPAYPLVFAKVRNSDTAFIEPTLSNRKMNHGIYVDIFPVDGVPQAPIKKELQRLSFLLLCKCLEERQPKKFYKKAMYGFTTGIVKRLHLQELLYSKLFSTATAASPTESEQWTYFIGRFNYSQCTMNKKIFGVPTEILFEGHPFFTVEHSHEYLTHVYGDYMILPPLEQRAKAIHADVFDCEKSYREFWNE